MAESPSRDPFGSGTETESEAESQDRERAERRKKREENKQVEFVDETILNEEEDEEEDDPMEDDSDIKECEERLRRIRTAATEDGAPATVPEVVCNKKNYNVPFVVKSKLSADLTGADSRIPQALKKRMPLDLNDSGKVKVKVTADQYGANLVADPSGADDVVFDTTYQSVRSLRKNLKGNMSLRGGGMETEKVGLGSFSNKNDERVGKCHMRFLVDKKQNITFSFDPVSMTCYNCSGGGHKVCNEGGGGDVKSLSFPIKTFRQHFRAPPENARKLSGLKMPHCRNSFNAGLTSQKVERSPRICCRNLFGHSPSYGRTQRIHL
jgi:hypothetical protein